MTCARRLTARGCLVLAQHCSARGATAALGTAAGVDMPSISLQPAGRSHCEYRDRSEYGQITTILPRKPAAVPLIRLASATAECVKQAAGVPLHKHEDSFARAQDSLNRLVQDLPKPLAREAGARNVSVAVHETIVAVNIEGFGELYRTNRRELVCGDLRWRHTSGGSRSRTKSSPVGRGAACDTLLAHIT